MRYVVLGLSIATSLAFGVAGCGSSDDKTGSGGGAISCDNAVQKLPAECDATARTCGGTAVPADKDACTQCGASAGKYNFASNSLTECACNHCAIQLAACFESATRETGGDANRDAACKAVVECASKNNCAGTECYCGKGVSVADCAAATTHTGLCATEIVKAAGCEGKGTDEFACVVTAQTTAGSALARAVAVGNCTTGDPTANVTGNCPQ